ncbi:MAG: hypothetical protein A3E37_01855 [Candidatus Andersenbacteria bacterium RIFCSPHIGHO2_12_FULL_46_9]|nr:MAG: Alanine racemase [Parcubacteria group bacterium GW2011_GWA2_45_14]OGY33191.1 MAG: hypothetical protein A3B76_04925 [Candidatus Andersenbacteria bacterium RIFCSPHIGHO2_02_FULL_46_16]OGY38249.1 MAG: hypothetical protein A3I08_03700 [Candidatus Andersenbacteria bacterium RIFCSPLOWO2_02_FULL_46_11]OGY38529.1 MAG: hypothetical protein A3E37_01855 [Candidatus Andersenbacteria bacterium RIFCSPHIGHO2_12_FULL_46_9]HBE90357.1 hypothetical protein [Candidatus Andersenbacteria bacterium]
MQNKLRQRILWWRAQDYLKRYHTPLIGVTGSTGKTIAKEAVAAVLSAHYRVRHSPLAYNTRLGIALSIIGITARQITNHWYKLLTISKAKELTSFEPDVMVLELAASHPGDIDYIATHLSFTGAVITNVQSTNLHLFTTKELIAHELTSLVVSIPSTGFVILNSDDPLVSAMQAKSPASVISYGTSPESTVRLMHARLRGRIGYACDVNIGGHVYELHLPNIVADYHILPVISALALAYALKLPLGKAIQSIQPLVPPPGHMRLFAGHSRAALLDDSYNASPESMLDALNVLRQFPAKRKIAILGDVLDAGVQTIAAHQQIGETVADITHVFVTVGNNMKHAGAAALHRSEVNGRQDTCDVHNFSSSRDVGKWLRDFLHPDDVVLIKGSRDMHMEEVVRRLLNNSADESQLVL